MKCSSCSAIVKPVVAVDIDGTLALYHLSYVQFVERYKCLDEGTLPRTWDGIGEFNDHLGLSKKEHHELKVAFRAGGFKRWMPAFTYAPTMMRDLSALEAEVWVTTTRPWMRLDNVDNDTIEWLRRNAIPYDRLLFDEDKYGRLCELVDPERIVAVMDDEEEQRDRCAELRLPFVLRRSNWNTGINHPGGHTVEDLFTFLDVVKERLAYRDALQH